MSFTGLSQLDLTDAKDLAYDLAQQWIRTNWLAYVKYDAMFEKVHFQFFSSKYFSDMNINIDCSHIGDKMESFNVNLRVCTSKLGGYYKNYSTFNMSPFKGQFAAQVCYYIIQLSGKQIKSSRINFKSGIFIWNLFLTIWSLKNCHRQSRRPSMAWKITHWDRHICIKVSNK